MTDFLRIFLGKALKSNNMLKFAVLTGCLRISKESIFTGINNFSCFGVGNPRFADKFGFTESDMDTLLDATDFSRKKDQIKEWYDGYIFGKDSTMYCPWDVMCYISELCDDPEIFPKNYWINTSENSIILDFLNNTNFDVKEDFERLMSNDCIDVNVQESLTYTSLYTSQDTVWSLLYSAGYLTKLPSKKIHDNALNSAGEITSLVIPNLEIRSIFIESVKNWFNNSISAHDRSNLFKAFWNGDEKNFQEELSDILIDTISYYDCKENFYHALTTGIFLGSGYTVRSNREYGTGRLDVLVIANRTHASVIEIKYTDAIEDIQKRADEAITQIDSKRYDASLHTYKHIIRWGICFCKKSCAVKCQIIK